MGNSNSRKDPPKPAVHLGTIARLPPSRPFEVSRPTTGIIGIAKIPPPDSMKPYIPERTIRIPASYELWQQSYMRERCKPNELDYLTSRISDNSKNELAAHKYKLNRDKQEHRYYTEKTTPTVTQSSLHSILSIRDRLENFRQHDDKYFSREGKLPELTADIIHAVENASKPNPSNEVLSKIEDVEILRKDIQTLLRLNWLNDEIINAYMLLLVQRGRDGRHKKVHTFNTFFYPKLKESGYSSVRRWTRKVDIFGFDFITVPVHLGNHWCLAFIDFTQRTISYYDSLGGHHNNCCDTLLDYLRDESRDKKKQDFDDENWRCINSYSEGIPVQKNCSDCGVFACMYAEYLTRQAPLKFSQEHMPYFRKKMIYELITKRILE